MKLIVTATALVAALSLVGCATDNDGEGGAVQFGLRPAKPSLDDQKPPIANLNPAIAKVLNGGLTMNLHGTDLNTPEDEVMAETIKSPFPIAGLCHSCDIVVLTDRRVPGELNVLDGYGQFFCRIWVNADGQFESTDCR